MVKHHWFSFTELQNMSFLDFKLYTEALFNKEAEEQKAREEAIKEGGIDMNSMAEGFGLTNEFGDFT